MSATTKSMMTRYERLGLRRCQRWGEECFSSWLLRAGGVAVETATSAIGPAHWVWYIGMNCAMARIKRW
jgi:hypothetical protein